MNKKEVFVILATISMISLIPHAESFTPWIPPTAAFFKIIAGSHHISAKNYQGNLTLIGNGITIDVSNGTNTPTITFTGSGSNPTSLVTMQNTGTGQGSVYLGNTSNTNFQFKTLKQGGAITIQNNTNDVTISTTGLSSIVNTVSLKNQTTNIGLTSLYTSGSNTQYRISVYQVDTQSAIAGTLSTVISWTDEAGLSQTQSPAPDLSVSLLGGFSNGASYIDVKSGTTIKYQTSLSGVTGNPQYNLFITVEKLS